MTTDQPAPPAGTIRDWLDRRADGPEGTETAYVFFAGNPASLSWRHLRDHARRLACVLTSRGIARGESIAIMMPNGPDAVIALFGALYGGFRATMINLVAGDDAISYALGHSETRFVLAGPDQKGLFERCARPLGIRPVGSVPDTPDTNDCRLHALSGDDDALLMYTSGTTGRPKGVVHSHESLLAGGWTTMIAHDLTCDDRGVCVLPVYHINGLCVSMMGALVSGGSIAMAPRFSASQFWRQVDESRATWFSVVPTIISHLLHSDLNPSSATQARVRFGRSASSALSIDVHTAFEKRFGVPLIETMGLTETAAQILSNPQPPKQRKIGSPGVACGNEVCILGPDLQPLSPLVQGEIAVRGPNVMRGYLKNSEATSASFTEDGWLRTGDLGHVDDDGYFFVTGRLKELIIKGGENIAPREIDEALYSHPDVIEAAAFARPCDSYGERVEAAVVIRAGSALNADALIEICRGKLGAFKCPDTIFVLDDLPKGPSGKIQRLKIAEITATD